MNIPSKSLSSDAMRRSGLEAMGAVAAVMVRAMQLELGYLPTFGDDEAPPVPDSDQQRPRARALLTPEAFETATAYGVALRPGTAVAGIEELLAGLDLPADAGGRRMISMTRLTLEMIRASFAAMVTPPQVLLNLDEAAQLIRVAPGTLTRLVSQGRISKSVKRGKPLVFYRDLLVQEWMCP